MARWENVSTNLHHQDLLWCVKGVQLRQGHLLNQAEVVDELSLPLGQLVYHLFSGGGVGERKSTQLLNKRMSGCNAECTRPRETKLTADFSTEEVEPVPAHILFSFIYFFLLKKPPCCSGDLLHRSIEHPLRAVTSGLLL